jgi:tetratricopeptide (TPR) repeat protein
MTNPHIDQEIDAFGKRGVSFLAANRLEEAADAFTRAFRMHENTYGSGHPGGLVILLSVAHATGLQGRLGDACELFDSIIRSAEHLGSTPWGDEAASSIRATAWSSKARMLNAAGKHADADHAATSAAIACAEGGSLWPGVELNVLVTQAQCAFSLGDPRRVVQFAAEALHALRGSTLDPPEMTSRAREIAQLLHKLDPRSRFAQEAWDIARAAAARLPEHDILRLYVEMDIAFRNLHESQAPSAAALEELERRVARAFGIGHPTHQSIQSLRADSLSHLGQHDEAVSLLRSIHRQAEKLGTLQSPVGRWVLRDLGLGLVRLKQYEEALSLLEQWIQLTEGHRTEAGDALMRSDQAASLGFGRAGIALAVCRHRMKQDVRAVFEAIERTSARGVADLVSQGGASLPHLAMNARRAGLWTAERTEQFLTLVKHCDDASTLLRAPAQARSAGSVERAQGRLFAAESLLRPMVAELVPIGVVPSLDEVRDTLRPGELFFQLADSLESVLAQTIPGRDGGTPQSHILIEHDERRVSALRRSVMTIVGYASGHECLEKARTAARDIVSVVFTPQVHDALVQSAHLIVCLGGALRPLSLDMLGKLTDNATLTTKTATYVPSASTLVFLRKKAVGRPARRPSLGAVGDVAYQAQAPGTNRSGQVETLPPLPRSANEIADIARSFSHAMPSDVASATDIDATESCIRRIVRGKSFIHIATHGVRGSAYDRQGPGLVCAPSDSGDQITLQSLITSWGGELQDTELVTLSACWSDSTSTASSDAFSLSLGFLHAGARYVLASPTPVPDLPTWLLMRRFYGLLLGEGGVDAASIAEKAPAILVQAKSWLANLSATEVGRLMDESPLPERYIEFQDAESEWFSALTTDRPFAEPRHWAGFRIIGG